ncbi:tail protein [Burkholderia sp. ST111]|nr:tail protein [Burkholderia sp. ST111]
MNVATASATATLTADEIVVETALGGLRYCLASFNKTINLATTGAGGMDTGTAPVSGFVALYAIYNPTSGASALLATNAATKQGNVYGGANMPAGYTASALVGVWPTNGSSQFIVGYQADRAFYCVQATALSTSTPQASLTSLTLTSTVPANAKSVQGNINPTATGSTATQGIQVAASSSGIATQASQITATSANQLLSAYNLPIITAQTIYYVWTVAGGTPSNLTLSVTGYTI